MNNPTGLPGRQQTRMALRIARDHFGSTCWVRRYYGPGDHHCWEVFDLPSGRRVGKVWWAPRRRRWYRTHGNEVAGRPVR